MDTLKPKVLIVDDDSRILELLKQFFERNDFEGLIALDAEEAEDIMSREEVDLLILDVMLPRVTGFEFAKKIKEKTKKTPIILLTALSEPDDRVRGLESGADDYITKPFDPRELILRAKNLLELYKSSMIPEEEDVTILGDCEYSFNTKILKMRGEEIVLSSTEQKLLEYFIQNRCKSVARDELSKVMGGLSDRSIDVQVVRLRQKIEQDPKNPRYLQTVRHEGYGLFF
jgi:two-component system phosphate regulon response regulator OmpR